jgi:8-oxo-dGTP pyrophosphatase MutT (NUDIX family)
MPFERAAGAIIIRREGKSTYFLLLEYPRSTDSTNTYWDLPKGHVEKGEKELETAKREVFEETGLNDLEIIDGFKEWIKYSFREEGKFITKVVTFFLALTKQEKIKISYEHVGYVWLPYDKALATLTFDNAKGILKKAAEFLKTKAFDLQEED